jgi:prevent-host-death family protein
MTREVGAYEAKTRLPELLRDVERGERITITVRGRPVAELAPPRRAAPRPADAVADMLAFEPVKGVDPAAVAEWIKEGRR